MPIPSPLGMLTPHLSTAMKHAVFQIALQFLFMLLVGGRHCPASSLSASSSLLAAAAPAPAAHPQNRQQQPAYDPHPWQGPVDPL